MSLDKLQVCIALPQAFPDGKVDVDLIRHYCARAESLGYHGLWTQEQVLGSTAVLEPLSLLTYAAALTSPGRAWRIRAGASTSQPGAACQADQQHRPDERRQTGSWRRIGRRNGQTTPHSGLARRSGYAGSWR